MVVCANQAGKTIVLSLLKKFPNIYHHIWAKLFKVSKQLPDKRKTHLLSQEEKNNPQNVHQGQQYV